MHITARVVICRRGPERQAGAARPDLVNAAILPSAQPLSHLRSRRSRQNAVTVAALPQQTPGPQRRTAAPEPMWGAKVLARREDRL
jgi:hypothetical protein